MPFNLATYLMQNAGGVGVLGAVVGGSAAAAKNYKDHKSGVIDRKDALVDTGKEAAGAGVATAASAVAAGVVGTSLLLSLAAAFATATVAKYAWDRAMDRIDELTSVESVPES